MKCILYLLDLRGVIDVDAYYLLDLRGVIDVDVYYLLDLRGVIDVDVYPLINRNIQSTPMFDMGNPKNHLDQIIKGDVHNGISYICTKNQ